MLLLRSPFCCGAASAVVLAVSTATGGLRTTSNEKAGTGNHAGRTFSVENRKRACSPTVAAQWRLRRIGSSTLGYNGSFSSCLLLDQAIIIRDSSNAIVIVLTNSSYSTHTAPAIRMSSIHYKCTTAIAFLTMLLLRVTELLHC